ncbi:MAG: zinc ribbon domain-containing protein [Treponema sp.]|jgi:predicted RNA-binding Zn-ribbon protein involved in translation (DUF1610 family)|nr:zinc ribbon domain-containing protein [Treponema sp.]
MAKAQPRFFCENCGAQVPLEAKRCPQCGRSFSSVRCPACGFTGEESRFSRGCPSCGYSPDRSSRPGERPPLPWWGYLLALAACTAVLSLLLIRVLR